MRTILLPIKPQYVEKIFNGTKVWEFKKALPTQRFDKVIMYATKPVGLVVGVFDVPKIFYLFDATVDCLEKKRRLSVFWEEIKDGDGAGITFEELESYYKKSRGGHVFQITNVVKFEKGIPLSFVRIMKVPQSWMYRRENV